MKRKQREKYSDDNLLRAIAEIKNKKHTYRAASNKYGIPIATLSDKVQQKVGLSTKIGE